jgi:hypothetical protein
MQTDAEHEEDHAQLGQLADRLHIADKPRRERSNGDPGHQITDNRRQTDATGDQSTEEGRDQGCDDISQQWNLMHNVSPSHFITAR